MSDILTAKDLCKTFSNESVQQHVLKNLNLSIKEGDFTVIMGNSGSGKSTLLYALSGMDRPTLGSISYHGEEISKYNNSFAFFANFSLSLLIRSPQIITLSNTLMESFK